MARWIALAVFCLALVTSGLAPAQAGDRPLRRLREKLRAGSPYPANPYYNPYVDVHYWYPKYYGGFHYRTLYRAGYSSPNYPYRGLPW